MSGQKGIDVAAADVVPLRAAGRGMLSPDPAGNAVQQAVEAELESLVSGLGRIWVDVLVEERDEVRE